MNEPRAAHLRVSPVQVSPHQPGEVVPRVKPRDPAGRAVVLTLCTALSRIAAHQTEAGRAEPEGVHRLRAALRRLRSELRALKDFVDPVWQEQLEVELKWLAGLLGDLRDLDILLARLREASLKYEAPEVRATRAFAAPGGSGKAARGEQRRRCPRLSRCERYRDLIATLERAVEDPPLETYAGEACRVALPAPARASWDRLRKAARDLRDEDPDEEFHEARKRAKSARYTAELIAPLLGRRAARGSTEYIRLTTRVQDALGEHQDALITVGELEGALCKHSDDSALVERVGQLLEDQRERARAARVRFFKIWSRLDRKKLRRWMKRRARGQVSSD